MSSNSGFVLRQSQFGYLQARADQDLVFYLTTMPNTGRVMPNKHLKMNIREMEETKELTGWRKEQNESMTKRIMKKRYETMHTKNTHIYPEVNKTGSQQAGSQQE